MEWIKKVTIVFDSQLSEDLRGKHNGHLQAITLMLRRDGKMFYHGKHSKITPEGAQASDESYRFMESYLLSRESKEDSVTVDEFLADAEEQRIKLKGVYL